ncbi:MAG TPA: PAS domain-containing protein, partial [Thermomicrobiales bacterium]|nr:PAS domain-containing protein [Thermomicrobiales bacterium]
MSPPTRTAMDDEGSAGELLAALMASVSNPIVRVTRAGIVTGWNTAAEQVFGYSAPEVIGQPATVLDAPGTDHGILRAMRDLESAAPQTVYATHQVRKGGQVFDSRLTLCPVQDGAGQISEVLVVFQ